LVDTSSLLRKTRQKQPQGQKINNTLGKSGECFKNLAAKAGGKKNEKKLLSKRNREARSLTHN